MIITFCNHSYIELSTYWVKPIQAFDLDYIIIASDAQCYEELLKLNVKTEYHKKSLSDTYWQYRMKVLYHFIESGIDIIHSDLDAIWKKNILPTLPQTYDLIISQGTIHPSIHHQKFNFVLCCGLFSVKSNTRTISFFHTLLEKMKVISDDQECLNKMLLNTVWTKPDTRHYYRYQNFLFEHFDEYIFGTCDEHNLGISLIPMSFVQRVSINNDGYIYHLVSPKDCKVKIDIFRKYHII